MHIILGEWVFVCGELVGLYSWCVTAGSLGYARGCVNVNVFGVGFSAWGGVK
jgi:hypothetical protein